MSLEKIMRMLGLRRREEAEAYAFMAMSDPSPGMIDLFSDLEENEVIMLSMFETIAKRYNIPWIKEWKDSYLRLKVSLHRAGRREFVQMVARGRAAEYPARPFILRRFLRRGEREQTMEVV